MEKRFCTRTDAGRLLAERLTKYADREDVLVLGIANNGIPLARAIADTLNIAMDVLVVYRITVPQAPDYTIGAVTHNDVFIRNTEIIERYHVPAEIIQQLEQRAYFLMEEQDYKYHANKEHVELDNRTVILVDDGIETGATMRAAITTLGYVPDSIIIATPVASLRVRKMLADEADEVVTLITPREEPVLIREWYDEGEDVTDNQAAALLNPAGHSLLSKAGFYAENVTS
jgi:putative phosphoribosyl transferase